jgi:hypothetical protein
MRQEFEWDAKSVAEAEETLRMVARQPAPERLTARVHERLAQERVMLASAPERRSFWRLWLPAHRVQFAGAAAVAAIIAISTLSVRHPDGKAPVAHTPVPVPAQSGAFGTGAAQGHPASLTPIPVPVQQTNEKAGAQAKKKKPSAGHSAKRAAKTPATGDTSAAPVAP